jgi:hypothetical protein
LLSQKSRGGQKQASATGVGFGLSFLRFSPSFCTLLGAWSALLDYRLALVLFFVLFSTSFFHPIKAVGPLLVFVQFLRQTAELFQQKLLPKL